MVIYLGADYAGYGLKEKIKKHLTQKGVRFEDLGCFSATKKNDFPDFAKQVATRVGGSRTDRGILFCATGQGMCIAANRFRRVRAVLVPNVQQAIWSRTHDNCNVLCLSTWATKAPLAEKIVSAWLATEFQPLPRRVRRFRKIDSWRT